MDEPPPPPGGREERAELPPEIIAELAEASAPGGTEPANDGQLDPSNFEALEVLHELMGRLTAGAGQGAEQGADHVALLMDEELRLHCKLAETQVALLLGLNNFRGVIEIIEGPIQGTHPASKMCIDITYKTEEDKSRLGFFVSSLALSYQYLRRESEATERHAAAASYIKSLGHTDNEQDQLRVAYHTVMLRQSEALQAGATWSEAQQEELRSAVATFERFKDCDGVAMAHAARAEILWRLRDFAGAAAAFKEAIGVLCIESEEGSKVTATRKKRLVKFHVQLAFVLRDKTLYHPISGGGGGGGGSANAGSADATVQDNFSKAHSIAAGIDDSVVRMGAGDMSKFSPYGHFTTNIEYAACKAAALLFNLHYTPEDVERAVESLTTSLAYYDMIWAGLQTDADRITFGDQYSERFAWLQIALSRLQQRQEALVVAESARSRAMACLLRESTLGPSSSRAGGLEQWAAALALHSNATGKSSANLSWEGICDVARNTGAALLSYSVVGRSKLHAAVVSSTGELAKFEEINVPAYSILQLVEATRLCLLKRRSRRRAREDRQRGAAAGNDGSTQEEESDDEERPYTCRGVATANTRGIVGIGNLGVAVNQDDADVIHDMVEQAGDDNEFWLHRCFECLIAPFIDALAGESRLVIIPAGDLFSLPFTALRQDTGSKYLMQLFDSIRVVPSIGVLKLLINRASERGEGNFNTDEDGEEDEDDGGGGGGGGGGDLPHPCSFFAVRPSRALVVGVGSGFQESLPPLPEAEEEAKKVQECFKEASSLWDCLILTQSQGSATKCAILREMEQCDVIHIATHGDQDKLFLSEDPEGSSVEINMAEISNLSLKAKVAVLSACDTFKGELRSDGVIGLSRAFLAAGCSCALVTLWPIGDKTTSELMERFYRVFLDVNHDACGDAGAALAIAACGEQSGPVMFKDCCAMDPIMMDKFETTWKTQRCSEIPNCGSLAQHFQTVGEINVSETTEEEIDAALNFFVDADDERRMKRRESVHASEKAKEAREANTPTSGPKHWAAFAVYGSLESHFWPKKEEEEEEEEEEAMRCSGAARGIASTARSFAIIQETGQHIGQHFRQTERTSEGTLRATKYAGKPRDYLAHTCIHCLDNQSRTCPKEKSLRWWLESASSFYRGKHDLREAMVARNHSTVVCFGNLPEVVRSSADLVRELNSHLSDPLGTTVGEDVHIGRPNEGHNFGYVIFANAERARTVVTQCNQRPSFTINACQFWRKGIHCTLLSEPDNAVSIAATRTTTAANTARGAAAAQGAAAGQGGQAPGQGRGGKGGRRGRSGLGGSGQGRGREEGKGGRRGRRKKGGL